MNCELLLQTIINDNINEFERLINEDKSYLDVSFGRFPLLSAMILFNSKKLVKKYTNALINKNDFIVTKEPFLLIKKFTNKARKITRLYYDSKIYPIDMLAILHKDNKVKKIYKLTKSDILTECKFIKVYEIYNQKVNIKNGKLKISFPKISLTESKIFRKYAFVCFLCTLIILGSLTTIISSAGLGTNFSYYKVFDEAGLVNAISHNASFRLYDNIAIKQDVVNLISNFSGNFDGNNKTLAMNLDNCTSLFNENSGCIKNLNVVVISENNLITDNFGLICNKNNGTINNLNIKFATSNDIVIQKTTKGSVSFCGVSYENYGIIKNVEIELTAKITAIDEQGDAYFSGVCDNNYGEISDVIVKSDGEIIASEVDIASIVINNFKTSTIKNCKNIANLTQNNEIENWSPTVAGICINNYGKILTSENDGNIVINSTNQSGKNYSCLGAGIVVNNYNEIKKCLNKGDLIINSSVKTALLGGIVSQSLVSEDFTTYSIINNCGNLGNFNIIVESSEESSEVTNLNYSYVGGIVAVSSFANNNMAFFGAEILDSFSTSKFTLNETKNLRSGLVIGGCYAYFNSVIFKEISNNFCLNDTETQFQIGSLINVQNMETGANMTENGIKTLSNVQELKQLEVYFDEI